MKKIGKERTAGFSLLEVVVAIAIIGLISAPICSSLILAERDQLNTQITMLQATIAENERYKDVQDQLEPATEAIEESRAELYDKFPTDMKEEDQLLYLLYLEKTLGTGEKELGYTQELHDIFAQRFNSNIEFSFGSVTPIQMMSDGAVLQGLSLAVYYHASYQDFKNMVHALATDERITSIRYATFQYNEQEKMLDGQIVLTLYLMPSSQNLYEEPGVPVPSTGKTDIFS